MTIFDNVKAAGLTVWDGKTPHKCPDCDFVTSSFHEYTQHRIDKHLPDFIDEYIPDGVDPDPVLDATIKRLVRSLFTGDPADGLAAVVDFGKARRRN